MEKGKGNETSEMWVGTWVKKECSQGWRKAPCPMMCPFSVNYTASEKSPPNQPNTTLLWKIAMMLSLHGS